VEEPMLDIRYFRVPAFSTGTGGMILVFLSMFGVMFLVTQYLQLIIGYSPLHAALAFLPMAPIMLVVSPQTPRLCRRFGANRTVALGMTSVAIGLLLLRGLQPDTAYWYLLMCFFPFVGGMALSMSPMTAAIMSAVPPRRAGAGSAMNDATRELGAALGVAVLGSVAATKYTSHINRLTAALPLAARQKARTSLADAIAVANKLPKAAGRALTVGSQHAFLDGIHLAVLAGAILAMVSAVTVLRYLPEDLSHDGAGHGAAEAMEDAAELGIGGAPPVFADAPGAAGP